MLKVKDVMVTDLVTVKADISVKKAVKVMNDFEIGCLIVVEDGEAIGIITERDILKRIVVEGRNPEKTLVGEVMSKPLIVTGPETSLEEAIESMFKHKIKKLPVVEGGKLVGLVTFTDIARIQPVMEKILRKLMERYEVPRRISKVVRYYIA
ncbi:CBS domain-containing protein [Candidatus Bathyarchaeota archaeon]|nr:CBS domain-containing protein [Candidatus Bathyarchaeota archaeon]